MGFWGSRYFRSAYWEADYWNGVAVPLAITTAASQGGGAEPRAYVEWTLPEWCAPDLWEVEHQGPHDVVEEPERAPEGFADHESQDGGAPYADGPADDGPAPDAPPATSPPAFPVVPWTPSGGGRPGRRPVAPDPRRTPSPWREGRRRRAGSPGAFASAAAPEAAPVADQDVGTGAALEHETAATDVDVGSGRGRRRPRPGARPQAAPPPPSGPDPAEGRWDRRLEALRVSVRDLRDAAQRVGGATRLDAERLHEDVVRARSEFRAFAEDLASRRQEADVQLGAHGDQTAAEFGRLRAEFAAFARELARTRQDASGADARASDRIEAAAARLERAAMALADGVGQGRARDDGLRDQLLLQAMARPSPFMQALPYLVVAAGGLLAGMLLARWADER